MIINNVKLLLGITDDSQDDLLNLLIEMAQEDFSTLSPSGEPTDTIIAKMVVYNYSRLGTEGLTSESYSGVSFNYSADYPEDILRLIKGQSRIRFI